MMHTRLAEITVRDVIALLIITGSFGTLIMFMYSVVPNENRDLMSFAFGAVVATTLPNVVRSYFPTKNEEKIPPGTDTTTTTTTSTPAAPVI